MKLKDIKNLIEYKGDFYTPEELAELLGVDGNFDVRINEDGDTWFEKAMLTLEAKKEGTH